MAAKKKKIAKKPARRGRPPKTTDTVALVAAIHPLLVDLFSMVAQERAATRLHELELLKTDGEYAMKRLETQTSDEVLDDVMTKMGELLQQYVMTKTYTNGTVSSDPVPTGDVAPTVGPTA